MTINRRAAWIAGIYALIGCGWILTSDKLLLALAPNVVLLFHVGIWKGVAFVFVLATAMLLYLVAVGESSQREDAANQMVLEATRASEARYRSLFDNMLDGFAYCRLLYENGRARDFVYLDVNPAFERLTGLKDVVGKKVSDVIPGICESTPELFEIYARVVSTGNPERFETYVDVLGIWFSIAVYCPGPEHFIAVFDNITERKQAEVKFRELNESLERRVAERTAELERANRELDAFSYSVSHDLRGPVRTIIGFCGVLEEQEATRLSEDGRMLLQRIARNTHRMGEMIEDLLRLSQAARVSLKLEPVDLNVVVSDVIARLGGDYPMTNIGAAHMPEVLCDAGLARQVFENLIANALKYSAKKPAPKVEIGVESRDDEVVFFVRDNGAGFDMRHANKLFGVFQRLHGASEFPGTGVGLVIVKRIIERHGGRVWAEGELENGATFCFTLEASGSQPQGGGLQKL